MVVSEKMSLVQVNSNWVALSGNNDLLEICKTGIKNETLFLVILAWRVAYGVLSYSTSDYF
jgi:hypothetical protein